MVMSPIWWARVGCVKFEEVPVTGWVLAVGVWVGVMATAAEVIAQSTTAGAGGRFENLGPQITATTLIGTTFAKDASGREVVCTVMRGQPAKLVTYDLRSGEMLKVLPLPGADGAWNATTASDGTVYVGTDANGHVYRYRVGDEAVTDLGQVPGQSWVWDLCPGKDGEIFVSTYPGCQVVRYHPKDGFREVSRGAASEGEQYARAVAYDDKTGKLYVGVGSHAHLVELDPATGEKVELLPGEYASNEFVYGVSVYGDHVFACVTNLNQSLFINTTTRKVEAVLPRMTGQQVMAKSPGDGRVYYVVDRKLWSWDTASPKAGPVEIMPSSDALGMTWVKYDGEDGYPGETLVVFTRYAGVLRYNPQTGKSSVKQLTAPKEPIVIQSIALGPDGRIWTAGYLSGGNAAFDPKTGKSQEYKGLSQAESMAARGNVLYFGIYPHGRFYAYDATQPWDVKRGNPKHLGDIEGQSRPFAAMGVEELDKVFWGTVPEYGLLGGGLAAYDVKTGKLDFHHNVVQDQSVIALAYADGLVVGGTSVWGGLGIQPTQTEGKLFLWDPKENRKVFEMTPVDGMSAVTCLINGPGGKVWGVAGGTLFVFDVANREIVSRHELFEVSYKGKTVWKGADLVVHPSGQVYGTLEGKFFRLDPATKRVTVLRQGGAHLLAMDRDGRLYFREKVDLVRYSP